jgi:hypothetical protein
MWQSASTKLPQAVVQRRNLQSCLGSKNKPRDWFVSSGNRSSPAVDRILLVTPRAFGFARCSRIALPRLEPYITSRRLEAAFEDQEARKSACWF